VCSTYFGAKKTGLTAQATLLHGDPRRVTPGLEDRPPKNLRMSTAKGWRLPQTYKGRFE
jgi:hypothetical protein